MPLKTAVCMTVIMLKLCIVARSEGPYQNLLAAKQTSRAGAVRNRAR